LGDGVTTGIPKVDQFDAEVNPLLVLVDLVDQHLVAAALADLLAFDAGRFEVAVSDTPGGLIKGDLVLLDELLELGFDLVFGDVDVV